MIFHFFISFHRAFQFETNTNDSLCQRDFIEIYSGRNKYATPTISGDPNSHVEINLPSRDQIQLVGRYCAANPPNSHTVFEANNKVWIKLSTDHDIKAPGFLLEYHTSMNLDNKFLPHVHV